jgi:hypothetical protein
MRFAWRVFSVTALLTVTIGVGYKWWAHGVCGGDYGYAGLMVAVIWWTFYLVARISAEGDPALRRVVIRVAAALALPAFAYHAYDATGPEETGGNLVALVGIGLYSYAQIFAKKKKA